MNRILSLLIALVLASASSNQDALRVTSDTDSLQEVAGDSTRLLMDTDSMVSAVNDSLELSIEDTLSIDGSTDTLSAESEAPDTSEVAPPGMAKFAMNIKKTKFAYFDTTHSIDRVIKTDAFKLGEELEFVIRYGPVVAGSATMAIPEIKKIKGRECYHIVSEARSSKFFSAFFRVRDRVESYMDAKGLFSWRFEKHLREGNFRADQYVEKDHYLNIAVTDKKDTLRIPPCIQDILTAFYYVRTLPMEVGKSVFIDTYADKKLYPLEVKVLGRERIKTSAGTFNCIVIEPMLRGDAIFKQRGRLTIWMTDDHRKIPVLMKSKVLIGSIIAEIKRIKGA
ncbi:MAG: DUF3108 domain-containing protein [candidate division KSB1 bacterium]|jgi:hypothetical protein|nr:DUF3108 domain-containing protein [candidate division KSB1 bacterium]